MNNNEEFEKFIKSQDIDFLTKINQMFHDMEKSDIGYFLNISVEDLWFEITEAIESKK